MKKIVKNKTKIFLVILLAVLSSGYLLSTHYIDKPLTEVEEENDNYETYIPEISLPNWSVALKHITSGSQVDPPYEENNIKSDDGLVDDTMFSPGYKNYDAIDYANYGVRSYTGAWGTTDGGLWTWTNAYRYNDGKYLFLETFNTVGWIHLQGFWINHHSLEL